MSVRGPSPTTSVTRIVLDLRLSPEERDELTNEFKRLVDTILVPALLKALPQPAIPAKPDVRAVEDGRLITKHDLEVRVGLDITTVYRQMRLGNFPQPIKIGKRRVAWREADIRRWEASRPVGTAKSPAWDEHTRRKRKT